MANYRKLLALRRKRGSPQPLPDALIVRPEERGEPAAGREPFEHAESDAPTRLGRVVAVEAGEPEESTPVIVPGDKILYSQYGGTEINVKGEDLLVVSERDVLAKLEADERDEDAKRKIAELRQSLTGDIERLRQLSE